MFYIYLCFIIVNFMLDALFLSRMLDALFFVVECFIMLFNLASWALG